MQRFFDMAMMFKVLDKESQKSKSLMEEEKKQEEPAASRVQGKKETEESS